MAVIINGDTGIDKITDGSIVTADFASTVPLGTKNLIINGNMQIAQRGTSAAGVTAGGYLTVDRFQFNVGNSLGTWTVSQDTNVPSGQGFATSSKLLCTTANASPATNAFLTIVQKIEAQNLQQLAFGTANAKSLTASFWVKSNKTGTYVLMMYRPDSGRLLSKTYTIDTADTWEKKTITVIGDTTGSINNDNGDGLNLYWHLGDGTDRTSGTANTNWGAYSTPNEAAGQTVNLGDTTSNYFNITGVQLEVGENATPFEHLQYGQQLSLCQRYYQSFGGSNANETVGQGTSFSTTNTYVLIHLLQTMRSVPSLGYSAVGDWRLHYPGVTGQEATVMAISTSDSNNTKVIVNTTTATNASMGGGKCIQLTADNTISARLTFSAEL
jgi:hypothetical protein